MSKATKPKPMQPQGTRSLVCGGYATSKDGKPGKPCEEVAYFFGASITGWWCSRHSHQAPDRSYELGSGRVVDNR